MKRKLIVSGATVTIAGLVPAARSADLVFVDSFQNNIVEDSDTEPAFWTPRLSGSLSATGETGGALRLTAGGSAYPHGQIASLVQSRFNFFRAPIVIQASDINFTSPTNSLNKGILRFSLSSRTLFETAPVPPAPPGADDSEYWADDVLAFRIESGNNAPGQYSVALGIKENYPAHNSEYDGFWLFNPLTNSGATLPGPVRSFVLAYSPKFWNLAITHDTSPTDPTPVTVNHTGGVDQFMSNWKDAADAGPLTGDSAMFIQSQLNNAAATEQVTASLGGLQVSKLIQDWQGGGTGSWNNPANWSDPDILHLNGDGSTSSVPNFVGANVRFGSSPVPVTIVTETDQALGAMVFDSPGSYTIQPDGAGQGTLQVDTRWFRNEITVLQGSHTIASPMNLYKDTTIDVAPAASVLTLGGGINNTAGGGTAALIKRGAGRVDVPNVRFTSLAIDGGTVRVLAGASANAPAGASSVRGLQIAGGPGAPSARLDLANNALVIDYDSASPIDDIRQYLRAGQLSGNGIVTSLGSAALRLGYGEGAELLPGGGVFAGQNVDNTSLVVAFALAGDADLNNSVNIGDFATLAARFNSPGRWTAGDFDYDGQVAISDFALLAANFNQSLPSSFTRAAVPEPASAAMVGILLTLRRRRRR